jgi:parallel beta-helix repeat protein
MPNKKINQIFASYIIVLLITTFSINVVIGQLQNSKTVIIYEDGKVEPTDAPIQIVGNIFSLTDNIDALTIWKENIVIDGNGHTFSGLGQTVTVLASGVTIKNLSITGSEVGILVYKTSNVTILNTTIMQTSSVIYEIMTAGISVFESVNTTIIGNRIVNNSLGIYLSSTSENNIIMDNDILDNSKGIVLDSSNNKIYLNNFVNNTKQIHYFSNLSVNMWNNQEMGNYWHGYSGTDNNNDGKGDTPYVIDENNQDNYPLMEPVEIETIPEFPSWIILPFFVFTTLTVIVCRNKLDKTNNKLHKKPDSP